MQHTPLQMQPVDFPVDIGSLVACIFAIGVTAFFVTLPFTLPSVGEIIWRSIKGNRFRKPRRRRWRR